MNRVFILGDSTAAPKEEAARPETGWGECFSPFLDSSWVLENRAVNGRSTKLALSNGDFFNALASCCEGDAALIQYGHNESKPDEERHTEPWTSFKDNLTYMANAFRKKGVDVYLLTPIARRRFVDGELLDTHGDYPKAVREVASELGLPLVDMTRDTMELLRRAGVEKSKEYFMNFSGGIYPNYPDGNEDNTHLRSLGAETIATMIYNSLKEYSPSFLRKE